MINSVTYFYHNSHLQIPMLAPGHPYTFVANVTEIFSTRSEAVEKSENDDDGNPKEKPSVKVILIKEGQAQPLLAATIDIPPTDPLMMPFC